LLALSPFCDTYRVSGFHRQSATETIGLCAL
jgi:hypothetical protein